MRTLDRRTKQVPDDLTLVDHPNGYQIVYRCDKVLAMNGPDDLCRVAGYALSAKNLQRKTVAWIGGGLCLGPRLFDISNCTQTIYEIEPALAEFCPNRFTFIPGDWRSTISGTYDVIVYDLGDDVPRQELTPFLAPGGIILPAETP